MWHYSVHEFDCDYCGKTVTWTGLKKDYVFRLQERGLGMLYFCSETCKRHYREDTEKLRKKNHSHYRNSKEDYIL